MAVRHLFLLWLCASPLLCSVASGASLFEDDGVVEVTLSGPIHRMANSRRNRDEYSFILNHDGEDMDVEVRIRGHSRVRLCDLPPLRLNFPQVDLAGGTFAGLNKVKMVTHCHRSKLRAEDSMLNEYAVYRLFNLVSSKSYRVRLLRVTYVDTDGKTRGLDDPHYAFVIEPKKDLAARLEGEVLEAAGVLYSRLDRGQTALMNVFQYMIGNSDWSFVTAEDEAACCHNVDLIDRDDTWYPIPYDFDLSGFVDAVYDRSIRTNKTNRREYGGYCRSSIDSVAAALDTITKLKEEIYALADAVHSLNMNTREQRLAYLREFFEAAADRERLLDEFERSCVGRH